jgi:type IV pilus assembly protein PilV
MHMTMTPTTTRRRAVAGYALLEAMVAVVVASVGFIGAARMQTAGMSLANSAQSRQKATLLGYQMTDRIRANMDGFNKGYYNNSNAGASVAADKDCMSDASGCTSIELAAADLREWLDDVAALPGGTGKICLDSTPNDPDATPADPKCDGAPGLIAVKIWWADNVAMTQSDNVAMTRFVTAVRP